MKPFVYLSNCLDQQTFSVFKNTALNSEYQNHPSSPHLSNTPYFHKELIDWSLDVIDTMFHLKVVAYKGCAIQRFSPGQSMGIHQDFAAYYEDPNDYAPTMSMVYYLNNEYSGGEICFSRTEQKLNDNINFDICLKPQENHCVIFDARMWHWVLPILNGNRYSYAVFYNAV